MHTHFPYLKFNFIRFVNLVFRSINSRFLLFYFLSSHPHCITEFFMKSYFKLDHWYLNFANHLRYYFSYSFLYFSAIAFFAILVHLPLLYRPACSLIFSLLLTLTITFSCSLLPSFISPSVLLDLLLILLFFCTPFFACFIPSQFFSLSPHSGVSYDIVMEMEEKKRKE